MKTIVKYQGGKTRELPIIKELLPESFNRVVEPFAGGASVSFHLEQPSILNDISYNLINCYRAVQDNDDFPTLLRMIEECKQFSKDDLSDLYYVARDALNRPHENLTRVQRAFFYIILKQLAFSGMERYNSKKQFNVPFGHYKKLSCNLNYLHHDFLKKCELYNEDFIETLERADYNSFVFLDPPYLNRLGYHGGDGGEVLHYNLWDFLKDAKFKFLLVHGDIPFYREKYAKFNIVIKEFNYAQRFGKGKNHDGAKVNHLYITNY